MIVAITGVTGSLGATTLQHVLRAGHRVRALRRPGSAVGAPAADVEWVEGNLDDPASLDRLVAGADAILHLAYCPMDEPPPTGRSVGEHFIETNIAGTVRLIERTPGTGAKQLVFASSLAVYGTESHRQPAAQRQPIDEDYPVWPREFYGAHKAALEKMVIAGSGDAGMNTCAFRLGCVLGSYRDLQRDLLARVVAEAREHGEIRSQLGAYVITDRDAAELLTAALGDATVRGVTFNAFDRWLDFAELAPRIAEILGRPVAVACDPAPAPVPAIRNQRIQHRHADWQTDTRLPELIAEICGRLDDSSA